MSPDERVLQELREMHRAELERMNPACLSNEPENLPTGPRPKHTRSDEYAVMFNNAPAFIAVVRGPNHVFEFANPPYMELVGNRNLLGNPVESALPEVREQGFIDLLDTVFRTGMPHRAESLKIDLQRAESGPLESRYITFVYQPLWDAAGQPDGIFVLGTDVSDAVAAQDALRRSEKLSAAGRLAATIAHEVNNPLGAMTNLLFLAREGVTPEGGTYLAMAEEELGRIAHITKRTLDFYQESSAPTVFDISQTVETIAFLYGKKAQQSNVALRMDLEPTCKLLGVEAELKQVLSNLIANALDAMNEEPGVISIRTRKYDGHVRLTVADNGGGIPSHLVARIWEPFFTTKAAAGTGLGLWVTREIVEKHGGTLRLRTRTRGRHGVRRSPLVSLRNTLIASSMLPSIPTRSRPAFTRAPR